MNKLLAALAFVSACSGYPDWDLDRPIYVSVAWNLPQPDAYVAGISQSIEAMGGHVLSGSGPTSSFAPPGAQIIHVFDSPPGVGKCDQAGLILGHVSERGIHICHNPAVETWVTNTPTTSELAARRTGMHETLHLGGLLWHWDCLGLPQDRLMGSERACQLVDEPTALDVDYGCAGSHFQGGRCDQIRRDPNLADRLASWSRVDLD